MIQQQNSSRQINRTERATQRECEAEVLRGNKTGMEEHHLFYTPLNCVQDAFLQNVHTTYERGRIRPTTPNTPVSPTSSETGIAGEVFRTSCLPGTTQRTHREMPTSGPIGGKKRGCFDRECIVTVQVTEAKKQNEVKAPARKVY